MVRTLKYCGLALFLSLTLSACQTPNAPPPDLMSNKSAVELRNMQTRAFDTKDYAKVLREIIATLQDLGYMVDKVEPAAGTVSANKLNQLRLTATVTPRGTTQVAVRANAMVQLQARGGLQSSQVDDPVFYQKLFFEPLSKSMFLSALQVADEDNEAPASPQTDKKETASPNKGN